MNSVQPMVQQGLNLVNQFGGSMNNKISSDKQAGLLNLLATGAGAGGLLGGSYGAYKAPGGARPEGFGRGAYRGAAAGLGAGTGAVGGGIGGGILGQVLSNAIAGRPQGLGERRHLPTILALLGAGLGGYGGGKLGWGMTGGDAQPEEEEKEAGHIQLDFKSASFSDDINEVRALSKKSSVSTLFQALGHSGTAKVLRDLIKARAAGKLPKVVGKPLSIVSSKTPKSLLSKKSSEKQANLASLLSGLGSVTGRAIQGGATGWGRLIGRGLKAKGFLPKATAVAGGGLSLTALNELLSSTKASFLELPHIGMGSDHPLWDPMMHHDRIDPKKTGFKSLFHMATRPLQTAAVATGMAKKPGSLADYARAGLSHDNRLSAILDDPKNFKIDPITGRGTASGEVPFSLDPTFQTEISDFNRQRERLESMGILPRRSGSSSTSGSSTRTRPFRGRFD